MRGRRVEPRRKSRAEEGIESRVRFGLQEEQTEEEEQSSLPEVEIANLSKEGESAQRSMIERIGVLTVWIDRTVYILFRTGFRINDQFESSQRKFRIFQKNGTSLTLPQHQSQF